MKLDKWPEEIECDGWRWRKDCLPPFDVFSSCTRGLPSPAGYFYRRVEKLHVPPTMKEIMEHLLKGGWARRAFPLENRSYYYKLTEGGEVISCYSKDSPTAESSPWEIEPCLPRIQGSIEHFYLIKPNEWFEGEGE